MFASYSKQLRAAIYARVSTEHQDDRIQVAELEDYCARWRWTPQFMPTSSRARRAWRGPA